ncbi:MULTISPECIES: efflux RND transporter periplasmic adaptor subunit [Alphaproteobacteria]|uniref:Membrane protein n=2 Tax=Alphaproteobacteria TaxID=28211 RepID=A0A512HES1_9HYPH|nr:MULTISPECIES: HlyD family efflux transporter periplasmic adaptor subunit [Alphaproteobacteria]GEO83850.1 membrane protein [Ciceribacter naphthalenivorans]GLR21272.1 membrane protein [Ciceribacter naphthalenivorans]GLT04128.1 membrane protein [Sphingomonas psychrolutea]
MQGKWIKRAIGVAAVGAMVAGFAYALRERPQLVDVGAVTRGGMRVTVSQEGVTRVREVYSVSSPIAGHLARTVLDEGDAVKAGVTVVAAIHPLDPPLIDSRSRAELVAARDAARAAVTMAEIDLGRLQSDLQLARDTLRRAETLAKTKFISQSALEKAGTDVEVLEAQIGSAEAAIELRKAEFASAEARLIPAGDPNRQTDSRCCVYLTAPVDGVVLSVFAKSEQPVAVGSKIAEIGDPSDLEVTVDLLSSDAVRIKPGAKAEIFDWGGDKSLAATVRRIDPAGFTKVSALGIEEQRVNLVLDLSESDLRLGHGFRVYARLTLWQGDDVLHLPISALFRNGRQWSVFVIRAGRARQVAVEIGHMNDEAAELLGGLAEGDRVILHPSDMIIDGTLVEERPE